MVAKKRSVFKLFGATFFWLIAFRVALVVALAIGVFIYVIAMGGDAAATSKQAMAANAKGYAGVLLAVSWAGRIAIFVMARMGKLPGTRFPEVSNGTEEAAFATAGQLGRSPAKTVRAEFEPIASTKMPVGFGQRGAVQSTLPPVLALQPLVSSRSANLSDEEWATQRLRRLRAAA